MRLLLPLLLTGLLATGCSEARDAARAAAKSCGLPADQFVGG